MKKVVSFLSKKWNENSEGEEFSCFVKYYSKPKKLYRTFSAFYFLFNRSMPNDFTMKKLHPEIRR
jgi:hypothetical protein